MNDNDYLSKEEKEHLFNKYICEIPLLYQKSLFECEQPRIFCIALIYASIKLAASLNVPKKELSIVLKDTLERYEDHMDKLEIIKDKLRQALNEAMKIIGENEKNPEVE